MESYIEFNKKQYNKLINNLEKCQRQISYMEKINSYVTKDLVGGAKFTDMKKDIIVENANEYWKVLETTENAIKISKVTNYNYDTNEVSVDNDITIVKKDKLSSYKITDKEAVKIKYPATTTVPATTVPATTVPATTVPATTVPATTTVDLLAIAAGNFFVKTTDSTKVYKVKSLSGEDVTYNLIDQYNKPIGTDIVGKLPSDQYEKVPEPIKAVVTHTEVKGKDIDFNGLKALENKIKEALEKAKTEGKTSQEELIELKNEKAKLEKELELAKEKAKVLLNKYGEQAEEAKKAIQNVEDLKNKLDKAEKDVEYISTQFEKLISP